jgi:hypothetical protein
MQVSRRTIRRRRCDTVGRLGRRVLIAVAAVLGLATVAAGPGGTGAAAQDIRFFRIGTGTTGGTYFPIGGLIANAISGPPGAPPCELGGSCGVPGLIAVAQASSGSVENIANIRAGQIESALVQADVATWAQTGTGLYDDGGALPGLRAIAHLYGETVHLVVPADSPVETAAGLAGLRVSIGAPGSGTLIDARRVLAAYGLDEEDIQARHMQPEAAADAMLDDELDAFFFVGGAPLLAIEDLAMRMPIRLVPFDDPVVDRLIAEQPFFVRGALAADVYPGVPPAETIEVGAQWVAAADIDAETVYGITRALWHPTTQEVLENNHPRGSEIRVENALRGVAIPIHPGALRYYREIGLLDAADDGDESGREPDADANESGGNSRGLDVPGPVAPPAVREDTGEADAVKVPNPFVDAFSGG